MTQSTEDRAANRTLIIKKLLDKANHANTSDEERDAYNAKAAKLMLQWGIEEATIADADRAQQEEIINVTIITTFPKGYSFEGTMVTVEIAQALNCSAYFLRRGDNKTDGNVVGFKSDVTLVQQLVESIALQCQMSLTREMATTYFPSYMNGTDKFNHRRSFVRGFAKAIGQKLRDTRRQFVEETGPGTDLVLVSRKAKVDAWVDQNVNLRKTPPRKATPNGMAAGKAAGQRADVGQSRVGGSSRGITA
jgi:hypothetical protein